MWKYFLAWTFVVGAWLAACAPDGDPESTTTTRDDADAAASSNIEGALDATSPTEPNDGGKTKDAKSADTGPREDVADSSTCTGCGGVCVDTKTDANHCGWCGGACPTGVPCVNGECTGSAGAVFCNAPGSPPCGQGKSCAVPPERCIEAACNGATEEGFLCVHSDPGSFGACCGGGCRDLRSDRNNCGGCGNVCNSASWCHGGVCEKKVTCAATNSGIACNLANDKTGVCCDGQCIDARTKDSCGACGTGCPTTATCRADGICVHANGTLASCQSTSDCAAGRLCSAGFCLKPSCAAGASGASCAFGRTTTNKPGTCCNGACVDLAQDNDACGACGTSCASKLCADGLCMPTPRPCVGCIPGQQCIDGTCVEPCNALSTFCASPAGGLGVCCEQNATSTCRDIDSDLENCGGCGVRCPAGQTCQSGVCSGASALCSAGHQGAYCDLATGESKLCCGGACTNITTDSNNCGRCGRTCFANESCCNGVCATSCK